MTASTPWVGLPQVPGAQGSLLPCLHVHDICGPGARTSEPVKGHVDAYR